MSLSVKAFQDLTESQNLLLGNSTKEGQNESKKTFFAGNMQIGTDKNSLMEQKRQLAQKQAFQMIGNAWENDKKTEDGLDKLRALYDEKLMEKGTTSKQISELETRKAELQKENGIDPESQEQKDLELLEEYQDRINGVTYTSFTKEKIERLSELQTIPKTEYQKRVLELNAQAGSFHKTINSLDQEIMGIHAAIRGTKLEQQKSQAMQNAQGASDEIMDVANKEIIGMLIQNGKESIDEKVEEEQKKAEELEAKKQEEQEKIDKIKESRDEQEELTKDIIKADFHNEASTIERQASDHVLDAQKVIKKIIVENDLLEEDLKGIKIDFNF